MTNMVNMEDEVGLSSGLHAETQIAVTAPTAETVAPLSSELLPKYRIGTVSRLTGLSADVVRVWERRYRAITPRRSEGGSRLYAEADVERLRKLRQAVEFGHAIGQVAHLPMAELERMLAPHRPAQPSVMTNPQEIVRLNFLNAIARMDVVAADFELSRAATLYPPRTLVEQIVAPLLTEIGERWAHQELGVAHEHVASNLIRNLFTTLFRLYPPLPKAPRIVMATLQGERHEFGLLLAALYAVMRGWNVIYLGTDLPAQELIHTLQLTKARIVALSLIGRLSETTMAEIHKLAEHLPPATSVWVGGSEALQHRALFDHLRWTLVEHLNDLDHRLQ